MQVTQSQYKMSNILNFAIHLFFTVMKTNNVPFLHTYTVGSFSFKLASETSVQLLHT